MEIIKKMGRVVTSVLPVDANRGGSCNRCGECCKLVFRCPFLKEDDEGLYSCAAYKVRPPLCRKFPRVEAHFDLVKGHCGYTFNSR